MKKPPPKKKTAKGTRATTGLVCIPPHHHVWSSNKPGAPCQCGAEKWGEKTTRKRPPKQPAAQDLPGLEGRGIPDLEACALEYREIRDERMDLTRREVMLKERAMRLMHDHGKQIYKRDGLEIELVPGEESIKVRIKEPDKDDAGEASA